MILELASDPADFLRKISPTLKRESTVHSFILSLLARYVASGSPVTRMVRAHSSGEGLLMAGIQTESDRVLIVSKATAEVAAQFARSLGEKVDALNGCNGPIPAVDAFAETWCRQKGLRAKLVSNLRLFELRQVIWPTGISGQFRIAEARDEQQIFAWLREFHDEAVPHDPKRSDQDLTRDIRTATQLQQYFIWEDGGAPVCLVGSRRETEEERWIAPVYTPRNLRGRGYASALVAAVSQRIVESGKRGMLFTDLANPTSNSIYQKVGYRPVTDFKHFLFAE